MITRPSEVLVERPWQTNANVCKGSPWGFLGKGEGHLLYYLARDYFRGYGVIVDAGSFLGRSAWFFGIGLAANQSTGPAGAPPIHCFDNFIVNDQYTNDAVRAEFGQDLPIGASTRHLFDNATRPVAQWLEVHEGDFHSYSWEPRPIEILFVDITKAETLNQRLVELMFPCLIPGRSLVVQQDYHHPWLPHVHMTMEYLHDHFEIVEPKVDDSAAFLLTTRIPEDKLRVAARVHELPLAEQLALMERSIRRMPEGHRRHVELARAYLLGQRQGYEAMRAALDDIDAEQHPTDNDSKWGTYRKQMSVVLEDLRNSLHRGWQLAGAGEVDEALRIAESCQPSEDRYSHALILRARCLRELKRPEEAGAVIRTALALPHEGTGVWAEKARLELALGHLDAAVSSARQGLAVQNETDAHAAQSRDVLAQALAAIERRNARTKSTA